MSALAISTAAQLASLRNNLNTDVYLTNDIDLSATMMATGNWETSISYRQWIVIKVESEQKIYRCLIDHTSGTFADDLAAGKWEYVRDYVPTYSSSSTYAVGAEVIYGGGIYQCITAITVPEAFNPTKWVLLGSASYGWSAIASSSSSPFTGSFDGRNHTIKNMFCINTTGDYVVSLFGYFNGSSAVNLSLYGFCLLAGYQSGCFAATIGAISVIKNMHIIKFHQRSINSVGGIVGNCAPCVFQNCSVNAVLMSIGPNAEIGALCGYGFLAYSGSENIIVSGRIISGGSANRASGIGWSSFGTKIKNVIINISFEGDFSIITGITNSESANNAISNVLNISIRTGSTSIVYGIAPVSQEVVNCYVINTFGGSDAAYQRTSAQLKQRGTFAGWNFTRDWYLPAETDWAARLYPPNNGYPCLRKLWKIGTDTKMQGGQLIPISGLFE